MNTMIRPLGQCRVKYELEKMQTFFFVEMSDPLPALGCYTTGPWDPWTLAFLLGHNTVVPPRICAGGFPRPEATKCKSAIAA